MVGLPPATHLATCVQGLERLVDAVVVATPPGTHAEVAVALLQAGVHCLIEKPLAARGEDVGAIIKAAKDGGAIAAVGFSERFNDAVSAASRRIAEQGPFEAKIQRFSAAPPPGHSVDVIDDLLCHDLDWFFRMGGSPETQFAVTDVKLNAFGPAALEVTMQHQQARWRVSVGYEPQFSVRTATITNALGNSEQIRLGPAPNSGEDDPLTRQARAFVTLVSGQSSGIATLDDAVRVATLSTRIRNAAIAAGDRAA